MKKFKEVSMNQKNIIIENKLIKKALEDAKEKYKKLEMEYAGLDYMHEQQIELYKAESYKNKKLKDALKVVLEENKELTEANKLLKNAKNKEEKAKTTIPKNYRYLSEEEQHAFERLLVDYYQEEIDILEYNLSNNHYVDYETGITDVESAELDSERLEYLKKELEFQKKFL